MNFLLIVVLIIPIVFVGYLASRLDRFLEVKGFAREDDMPIPTAAVLGDSELSRQVAGDLESRKIKVVTISEPLKIMQKQYINYLFALSDDDADNITLCKIARKVYGTSKIVSLCNDKRNLNMYAAEGIQCISGMETAAQSINCLLQNWGADIETIRTKN